MTKTEILSLLSQPREEFEAAVLPQAKAVYRQAGNDELIATAMLGFSNICKNACLYCGMRAACKIERYRIPPEDVIASAAAAKTMGLTRMFLISGEDLGYGFDKLLRIISEIKALGMHVSLACGEFSEAQYAEMKAAGADEYVLKFEMSHRETFNRLNPSTDFDRRMASIAAVRRSGMKLASGNIVDYPGQTLSQLADDILLMQQLEISWAPIIPYLPAAGTPLALEGGRGDLRLNLREIALLRLMMPSVNITAQQPGDDLRNGLADEQGNLMALNAGANMLFADLLPDAKVRNFSVIDNRAVLGMEHIRKMASLAQMKLV